VVLLPELPRGEMRIVRHVARLLDDARADAAASSLRADLGARSRPNERVDRAFPLRTGCGGGRRAIETKPVDAAEPVRQAGLVDPPRQRLVRGRAEAPGHQTVEAPSVGEPPETAHGRAAVVQRLARAVELAPVELPREHRVHRAAERDLLDRDVDVLAEPCIET